MNWPRDDLIVCAALGICEYHVSDWMKEENNNNKKILFPNCHNSINNTNRIWIWSRPLKTGFISIKCWLLFFFLFVFGLKKKIFKPFSWHYDIFVHSSRIAVGFCFIFESIAIREHVLVNIYFKTIKNNKSCVSITIIPSALVFFISLFLFFGNRIICVVNYRILPKKKNIRKKCSPFHM